MPNHCSNDLWITGPTDIVNKISRWHLKDDGSLDCDSIVPYPENFKKLDEACAEWRSKQIGIEYPDYHSAPKDGFNSGGYEWCCENWGTKWGTYDGIGIHYRKARAGDTRLAMSFLSAWAPPLPVIKVLAEMYPECRIKLNYYECGVAFKGSVSYSNGQIVANMESSNYAGGRGG